MLLQALEQAHERRCYCVKDKSGDELCDISVIVHLDHRSPTHKPFPYEAVAEELVARHNMLQALSTENTDNVNTLSH